MVEVQFSEEEKQRYTRHFIMDQIGEDGQKKLKEAKVLVVGTGGLGSPIDFYLAAAGIGTLGIVDSDVVDASNLQRQILHSTPDIGRPKVISAMEKLTALNPHVNVIPYQLRITPENAEKIISEYDLVVDGTDNFATRFILNDTCVALGKPFIFGAIMRFTGQLMTILPGQGPCFRCLFPNPPAEHEGGSGLPFGVVGPTPGTIGSLEAMEALKIILGQGKLLVGRLLAFDGLNMDFEEIIVERDASCPVCGGK